MVTSKRKQQLMNQCEVKIGYARVSSMDNRQKLGLEVQTEALKSCHIIFSEKQSGSKDNRQELSKAIGLAKQLSSAGVSVSFCVYKMDRLSRKTSTLLKLIEELNESNIDFISLKENIDTATPTGVLMYQLLGIFAEFELNNLKQRTREGLAQAKANGKKLGNQGLAETVEQRIIHLYSLNSMPIKEIARRCNVCEATIYNVIRRNQVAQRKNAFHKT